MTTFERYIEELLKLQRCFRVQNIILYEIFTKEDIVNDYRAALTLSVALWSIAKMRQSSLGYSELVYIQRRLAQFLAKDDKSVHIIKKLFELIPMRYGMNVSLAARRCGVYEQILIDIVKALNVIRDVIDMISVARNINEPIKHSPTLCLNDVEMLPPTTSNTRAYLDTLLRTLKESSTLIHDPVFRQVIDVLYEETANRDLTLNDFAAISLIVKLIAESVKPSVICADPCINIAALSQKILNDLASIGAVPYDSEFYKLYQEVSMRSVIHGAQR